MTGPHGDRRPLKLLVIEDDELDAELVELNLTRHGYAVHAQRVDTSDRLLAALEEGGWDLAVCDHNLPGFGAPDPLALVLDRAPGLPFVVLSGTIGEEAAVDALKRGARDVVVKSNLARIGPVVDRELAEAANRRERDAAQQALRESEARKSAILESALDCIITMDHEGRIVDFNPAAERAFGIRRDAAAGRRLDELIVPPAFRAAHRAGVARAVAEPSRATAGRRIEVTALRVDGTTFPAEVTITRSDVGGRPFFTGYLRDITERVRREEELLKEAQALAWVRTIRDAVTNERFVLHAQPVVDLATRDVIQHELLIRLPGADGRLIAPGEFLPVAERYGLVGSIDRWVIGQGARLIAAGHPVHVNVSVDSLGDPGLFAFLAYELEAAGADPRDLVIELTETALMRDERTAGAFIEKAVALGCQIALDDFGTGYGSLTYLKRLPVTALKIDREFVRDLIHEEGSRHVVAAVVRLARDFGPRVIAEGVEDEETAVALLELGVHEAQGWHFGYPATLDDRFAG